MTSPDPAPGPHGCRFREAPSLSVMNRDFTTGDNFARVTYPDPLYEGRLPEAFCRRGTGAAPCGQAFTQPWPTATPGSMLPDPPHEVVSHAGVQCPVSSARQDLNVETHCVGSWVLAFAGRTECGSHVWQNEPTAGFWQNETTPALATKPMRYGRALLMSRRFRAGSQRCARRAAARGAARRLACRPS
jgi:hypothetical protein